MTALVTVPGDIPGLLRLRAPVLYDGRSATVIAVMLHETHRAYDRMRIGFDGETGPAFFLVAPHIYNDALFVLSDPAGRDIAARWMAERLGMKIGLTAPSFYFVPTHQSSTPGMEDCSTPAMWILAGENGDSHTFYADKDDPQDSTDHYVAGLPLDPDKGPEAMRAIVLHLAGRQS